MTILARSQLFQQHKTGAHPECPERLRSFEDKFADSDLVRSCRLLDPVVAASKDILAVHGQKVIDVAINLAAAGGGSIDPDTVMSERSLEVATHAAGTLMSCVDQVLAGEETNALALIRPPGHHATKKHSMGFCIYNNVAIAAAHALQNHDVDRILIVDWDVHHGNGTQDIFYDDERVFFYSIHRYPFYPGTGSDRETGTGKGLGYTLNKPMEFGTSRQTFLSEFVSGLEAAAKKCKPDLVLISAGFDAHKDDPVGNIGLETHDFAAMTCDVMNVANDYCGGRLVSTLEGGYNLGVLPDCIEAHLKELRS